MHGAYVVYDYSSSLWGSSSFIRILIISVAPSIVVAPVSTVQQLNSAPLSLNCVADGFPLPIITWIRILRNGSETVFPVGLTEGASLYPTP